MYRASSAFSTAQGAPREPRIPTIGRDTNPTRSIANESADAGACFSPAAVTDCESHPRTRRYAARRAHAPAIETAAAPASAPWQQQRGSHSSVAVEEFFQAAAAPRASSGAGVGGWQGP
jgi:hypothetical protein